MCSESTCTWSRIGPVRCPGPQPAPGAARFSFSAWLDQYTLRLLLWLMFLESLILQHCLCVRWGSFYFNYSVGPLNTSLNILIMSAVNTKSKCSTAKADGYPDLPLCPATVWDSSMVLSQLLCFSLKVSKFNAQKSALVQGFSCYL